MFAILWAGFPSVADIMLTAFNRGSIFILLRVCTGGLTFSAPIRISVVQPQCPIVPCHPSDFTENLHHPGDIFFGRGFKSELLVDAAGTAFAAFVFVGYAAGCQLDVIASISLKARFRTCQWPLDMITGRIPALPCSSAIVSEAPIRRTGHRRLHDAVRQSPQDFQCITLDDLVTVRHHLTSVTRYANIRSMSRTAFSAGMCKMSELFTTLPRFADPSKAACDIRCSASDFEF